MQAERGGGTARLDQGENMIWLFVAVGALGLIGTILKTPWFRGMIGEFYFNLGIRLFLDKQTYRLVKNVTLPTADGTTQIDHIVVSRYGIFVIETKNMKGAIYGAEHDGQWTQVLGRHKHKFQNPLRQNYKHTQTLAEILGVAGDTIKPVIMFVGEAKLKTPMPPNVLDGGFGKYARSFKTELLSEQEVARILEVIAAKRLAPGLSTHVAHVRHVRSIVEARESAVVEPPAQPAAGNSAAPGAAPAATIAEDRPPLCPVCGKGMVLRTARKGGNRGRQFWGCTAYPACRGTMPHE